MESLENQNIPTLRISQNIIEKSNSLNSAVNQVLKSFAPNLINNPEELIFKNNPVFIIDDINRSNRPQRLLNKIGLWVRRSYMEGALNYTIVCPLWSRNVYFTPLHYKESHYLDEILVQAYSEKEIVKLKQLYNDFEISQATIESLDNNPFLIGKVYNYRLSSFKPNDIIEDYLKQELALLSEENENFESHYLSVLKELTRSQLLEENLYQTEEGLYARFNENSNILNTIKKLVTQGSILYLSKSFNSKNTIRFRHDKIHEYFIKQVIQENIENSEFKNKIILNPYFSEYVGGCLLKPNLKQISEFLEKQPLIPFYYLKHIREPKTDLEKEISNKVLEWFKVYTSDEENSECAVHSAIIDIIYDLEASLAIELIKSLKHGWDKMNIGFQNGDLKQSINFFANRIDSEPGIGDTRRDRIILHHKTYDIDKRVNFIKKILEKPDQQIIFKQSALIYAGYLAEHSLSDIVMNYFRHEKDKDKVITEAIWAIMNCSKNDLRSHLSILFGFWKTLPIDDDDYMPARRKVADRLKFSIRRINNDLLDKTLVELIDSHEEINGYLFGFIKQIDSPTAIEKHLQVLSNTHDKYLKSEGHFPVHLMGSDLLFRKDETRFRSSETKKKLKLIWQENEGSIIGNFAFDFWSESIGKKEINKLKEIKPDSKYFHEALERRIRLNDRSCIELAFDILKKRDFRNSKKIWNEKLFEKIKNELISNPNIPISRYLLSIPENHATILLHLYDENRQNLKYIFQYGLYIGTPESIKLSKSIFHKHRNDCDLFQYISQTFSNLDVDRKKNLSISKLNNLNEYIQFMSKDQLYNLISMCQRENMLLWAKQNIGNKVTKNDNDIFPANIKGDGKYFFLNTNQLVTKYFKECRCPCNKYCRLNSWIEDIESNGITVKEFKTAIKEHVKENQTLNKFKDLCAFLRIEGNKEDINWLQDTSHNYPKEETKRIIEDTIFEISKTRF